MEYKIIITCPNRECKEQFRVPSNKHIKASCPKCKTLLLIDMGLIQSYSLADNFFSSKYGKNTADVETITSTSIFWQKWKKEICVASLLIVLAYLFYPGEYLSYRKAITEKSLPPIDSYLHQYPNGKYKDEVFFLKDSIFFDKVKLLINNHDCDAFDIYVDNIGIEGRNFEKVKQESEKCKINFIENNPTIKNVVNFLTKHPTSIYNFRALQLYDSLWHNIYKTYDINVANSDAKTFFRLVLDNAKESRDFRVGVTFNSKIALKDWEDYPIEVRNKIDNIYALFNKIDNISLPPPGKTDMPSIKNVFIETKKQEMQENVIGRIKQQLEQIFGEQLIDVIPINKEDTEQTKTPSTIFIDYDVKSSSPENQSEFPSIYVYSQTEKKIKRYLGYVLGVSISWKMTMVTAQQSKNYKLGYASKAENEYSNVGNMNDVYSTMVDHNFMHFADYIGKNFGWIRHKTNRKR